MKRLISMGAILAAFILLSPVFALPPAESNSTDNVVMHGAINLYGTQPAFGWCGAYAKIEEWARVYAFWMPENITFKPPMSNENFTATFYEAVLVNATIVELNYTGNDFYISGLWSVYSVTFSAVPYNITYTYKNYTFTYTYWNVTWTLTPLVVNGTGDLSVTGNWTNFVINISGIPLLSGEVMFHRVASMPIPMGDVYGPNRTQDSKVDIWDLQHVAHNYGSTPVLDFMQGKPESFNMDFNFNFQIDIYDLTTIAVNIGESY